MRKRLHIRLSLAGLLIWLTACSSGYAGQTSALYDALWVSDRQAALAEAERLVAEAVQENANDLLASSYPLLLLERGAVYQSLNEHELAVSDFYEADQMLEVLDLTPGGTENLTRYLFTDDARLYRAPMYEKVMVNVSAILSYLAMGDHAGAMVEARRITVLLNYYAGGELVDHPMIGAAHYLAGIAMELGGDRMEALRHYITAYRYGSAPRLAEAIVRLAEGSYMENRSEVVDARAELGVDAGGLRIVAPEQELVVIVLSGLPPRREAERFPLGAVFGWIRGPYSYSLMGFSQAEANRVLAERAMTWVNFPVMVSTPPRYSQFTAQVEGQRWSVEPVADVESFALEQWELDRPAIAASAVTRAIFRILVREATQAAAGDDNTAGFIAGLALQGILQAIDTPDTRSWRSMPAAISIARLPVSPGQHQVAVIAGGSGGNEIQTVAVDIEPGWSTAVVVRFF